MMLTDLHLTGGLISTAQVQDALGICENISITACESLNSTTASLLPLESGVCNLTFTISKGNLLGGIDNCSGIARSVVCLGLFDGPGQEFQ